MVDAHQVEPQWQRYVDWGFKDDVGISENGLLIRLPHDARDIELMEYYRTLANAIDNVHIGAPLAEYKYYYPASTMEAAVEIGRG